MSIYHILISGPLSNSNLIGTALAKQLNLSFLNTSNLLGRELRNRNDLLDKLEEDNYSALEARALNLVYEQAPQEDILITAIEGFLTSLKSIESFQHKMSKKCYLLKEVWVIQNINIEQTTLDSLLNKGYTDISKNLLNQTIERFKSIEKSFQKELNSIKEHFSHSELSISSINELPDDFSDQVKNALRFPSTRE
ncbi:hypothetical protein [Roseivirga pacifica]|uniref:hypothetical protein n=1 Tax=Roseivirga pacifica TaxID=1267423 RepID=UPI0020961FDD|nr:hypothetical protein [Roseivirga pacifica]MCO6359652.1 hypothetical protein [Roseivirga pacifica]MCO6367022.1 hypothetical protein [Roseivirga pacifica]MCO6370446.1 hypothetical protein [Roseivirga pacifica]MCO6374679.1 hypothetical protein [Roseivirga pacifica]MCO6379937.1 hypothetical protein [Roseivirga pacifica]